MPIHWNILDDERRAILPLLHELSKRGFYLAGGTGLALQLGHRDSIDFDFFTERSFDAGELASRIESLFAGHKMSITQQDTNTLSFLIDTHIQMSFLGYRYPLLKPLVQTDYFPIASIEDIGCMKLSAIVSRSVEKDYVDLYAILHLVPLAGLLSLAGKKYPTLDAGLILKSLVYFTDVLQEPILFKENHDVSFDEVKTFLEKTVHEYFNENNE